jgi:hypothetical protein
MLKPLLTISEVVSITAPVIEEFAQEKISAKNLGFEALDRTISLCSDVMTRKALDGCRIGYGRRFRASNQAISAANGSLVVRKSD